MKRDWLCLALVAVPILLALLAPESWWTFPRFTGALILFVLAGLIEAKPLVCK